MKYMLGKKEYMTQVFAEDGRADAATVLSVAPLTVLQKKTKERDGYYAVQLGAGVRKTKRVSKAVLGHTKKATGEEKGFEAIREFRTEDEIPQKVGDALTVSEMFSEGDVVTVSAISKGKGFQGVVKRHGFHGGPRSHGQKHSEREGGSIGSTGPQRVFKGTKMPGRMGGERVTVKNLRVLAVDAEKQLLIIKGAIPGRRGTMVEVYES